MTNRQITLKRRPVGKPSPDDFAIQVAPRPSPADGEVLRRTIYLSLDPYMPGLTAYVGLVDIGQPKAGETVVVSAASGAVGSVVGQLAKLRGCRAVGIAGSADKCRYVVEELGFDACVNYKAGDLVAALRAACPNRIDIDFENVGGAVLAAVLRVLNRGARIPLCGRI